MKDVVIVDAVRSAVGRAHKGSLAQRRPDELAGEVVRALFARVPQIKPELVGDLVLGCAMPEGEQGLNVARVVGFLGGLPKEASAVTINRFCSSGLQALAMAAADVGMGWNDVVLAGGVESMSMVPMTGNKLSASPEAMAKMASVYTPMGITAENVANRFEISRDDQDAFALQSHQRAAAAQKAGRFNDEIVAVHGVRYENGAHVEFEFKHDELIRAETTKEALAQLKPAFSVKGSVTAGNSSPLSDGAAAALVTTKERAEALGVKPLGYFRAFATAGVDPSIMGIGPVPAIEKLLSRAGLSIGDIDLFEINEAFASQAVYVQRKLGIPGEKLNVNGGAIALGHPLGCTGAKLTATALHELRRRGGKYAIVSMCIGGGQGAAGLLERFALTRMSPMAASERRRPRGYTGRNHETLGSDILAVYRILKDPEQVLGSEEAQRLAAVAPAKWYPIEWLLHLMDRLDSSLGHYGLIRMGRALFDLSHKERVLEQAHSARDIIYGIDGMYHHANRGSGIGGWTVVKFEPGLAQLEKTTPHHCIMEQGLLSAAFAAVKCPVVISQDKCFRKNEDACLYTISSARSDERWFGKP